MKSTVGTWQPGCDSERPEVERIVLKIERTRSDSKHIFKLTGRIGSDDVQTLKVSMEQAELPCALDLAQVDLLNLDAVRFLATLEMRGIELRNGRPHVRAWIDVERRRISDLE